jgi:hypothetical protein
MAGVVCGNASRRDSRSHGHADRRPVCGREDFAVKSGLDTDKVWNAISENLDALIAFFHILMTRDHIPLIDYEQTFNTTNFLHGFDDIALVLRPPNYKHVKEQAKKQLPADFLRIPPARREELVAHRKDELTAVGYNWFPADLGPQFVEDDDKLLATYLLGGLIFGGYAQISGSDHLLQDTRNKLLLEFTQPAEAPLWGAQQEAELFRRLNTVINRDSRLSLHKTPLPPTILPSLLEKHPASPRHLLDDALDLRKDDADFVSYRLWHRELREAWANGRHNEECEKDVDAVTKELTRRFPPGKDPQDTPPVWSHDIGIKATLGAQAGFKAGIEHEIGEGEKLTAGAEAGVKAGIEADLGKVPISFPDWIRNLLVEGVRFRGHRKVLLRMALAQRHTDNLLLGLRKLWFKEFVA